MAAIALNHRRPKLSFIVVIVPNTSTTPSITTTICLPTYYSSPLQRGKILYLFRLQR